MPILPILGGILAHLAIKSFMCSPELYALHFHGSICSFFHGFRFIHFLHLHHNLQAHHRSVCQWLLKWDFFFNCISHGFLRFIIIVLLQVSLGFQDFSIDRVFTKFGVFHDFFHVIHGDVSCQIRENTFISFLMGITGRHASFHQFSLFVVKCVTYSWRPWQFPYASPHTVIFFFIICTALVIWDAIIVGTSLAVRYFCARINLFRGVFSNRNVFFTVGTWKGYCPMMLNVEFPGKVIATPWTLNHFW